MRRHCLCLAFVLSCGAAFAQTPQDVKISGTLDAALSDDQLKVRSAEVLFYAPIDYLFDGYLNVAAHDEEGEYAFELHEAYLASSKLIPRSRIRAGKFFLNVGRLNGFHQHDWPFVTAPKMQREFFNPGADAFHAEGASDTGVEYSWLLPLDTYIDITVGVTNGYCFGHCDEAGERPPYPLHYIHPTTFIDLGPGRGLLLGASYLGRKDAARTRTDLAGLEATYKAREGKVLKWLMQSEVFYQNQQPQTDARSQKLAGYVFTQYGWDERWSAGLRADAYSQLDLKDETSGEHLGNLTYALVPQIAFAPSEFSRFRLAYSHEVAEQEHAGTNSEHKVQLQYTYFLGAHPAHDF